MATKLKLIKWNPKCGGDFYEGLSLNKLFLYDNRDYSEGTSKKYPISDLKNGRKIAKDLLNGLNLDVHEKSRLAQKEKSRIDGERFSNLISRSEELLAKYK